MKKWWILGLGALVFLGIWWLCTTVGVGIFVDKSPDTEFSFGITGQKVSPSIATERPFAVVIENHPDARPQSGTADADLVYEYLAEGGITRFLAVFQSRQPQKIGPVRSAREYSAELANSWGALFAHVGGSPQVLSKLGDKQYRSLIDINEFSHADNFWREKTRLAPHNAYTSFELLHDFVQTTQQTQWQQDSPVEFSGTGVFPQAGNPANKVGILFSKPSFATSYQYDPVTKKYLRSIAGQLDQTLEGAPVAVDLVVAQLVKVTAKPGDESARVDVAWNTGTGKAVIFYQGLAYTASWRGGDRAPEIFVQDGSARIGLPAGKIWWALVPDDLVDSVTWQP